MAGLSLINCTVANNTAQGGAGEDPGKAASGSAFGGGIYCGGGSASLLNVTVASNAVQITNICSGTCPVAVGASIVATNGTISLTNTVLSCSLWQTNVSGAIQDGGHNLCSDSSANFISKSSRSDVDPLLAPLADNGGATPTMALSPRSPAIDTGDCSAAPPTDQRGVSRPQWLGCDIGAFELAPKLTINVQNRKVTLDYRFLPVQTNRVAISANLTDWTLLRTEVTDTNGMFLFVDPLAAQFPQQFYMVQPNSN